MNHLRLHSSNSFASERMSQTYRKLLCSNALQRSYLAALRLLCVREKNTECCAGLRDSLMGLL